MLVLTFGLHGDFTTEIYDGLITGSAQAHLEGQGNLVSRLLLGITRVVYGL